MNNFVMCLLFSIKDGYRLNKKVVYLYQFNTFCLNMLNFLYKNGYIVTYTFDATQRRIAIFLKYSHGRAALNGLRIISRVNTEIFANIDILARYKTNSGTFVLSTSKGLVTLEQSLQLNIGGKILFFIF